MVRLTADLIWKSPHFFNPIKERELDLRGNKIAVIENLGATEDQFDTIDISDNEIVKLENFPYLSRLGTLIVNNNRITRISSTIGGQRPFLSRFIMKLYCSKSDMSIPHIFADFLPKLHSLILTNNRLTNLTEIDPLASLSKLQFLSLLDNSITKKSNYRLYVIYRLKALRVLDFKKVKKKERLEAENMFASMEAVEMVKTVETKTFTPGEVPSVEEAPKEENVPKKIAPTPEQILAVKAAIVNSQTLEEVARLEKALKSGQLPENLLMSDAEPTTMDEGNDDDNVVTNSQPPSESGTKDAESQENDTQAEAMEQGFDSVPMS
ncbi:U2 small nuclear ribonucleoprotein A'-like protein [Drosera capensis]